MDCTLWTVLFHGSYYFMDCITFRIHFQLPFVSPKPLFCNNFFFAEHLHIAFAVHRHISRKSHATKSGAYSHASRAATLSFGDFRSGHIFTPLARKYGSGIDAKRINFSKATPIANGKRRGSKIKAGPAEKKCESVHRGSSMRAFSRLEVPMHSNLDPPCIVFRLKFVASLILDRPPHFWNLSNLFIF
ncbi:predicted protein [Clavispora lusitaniae ATCC 42720]|uniref:Uncharacterized protein n=1 Tax=Clavispora lusitaniae (strain ATCC 42720) TaxID=306902 RepID=C4Y209_CLAL4|nr:uncharacterized protein CLUG_02241 [Clavispora lusitaniae ATCC 42720]EEQ38118.1 predicted protein [Clavispora lusitaniae ATCC 42720]